VSLEACQRFFSPRRELLELTHRCPIEVALLIDSLKFTDPHQILPIRIKHGPDRILKGSLQRITNDMKDYQDLNLNREGRLLFAVESETISRIQQRLLALPAKL